jgi:hypothetical protein
MSLTHSSPSRPRRAPIVSFRRGGHMAGLTVLGVRASYSNLSPLHLLALHIGAVHLTFGARWGEHPAANRSF